MDIQDKTGTGLMLKGRFFKLDGAGTPKIANFREGSQITELYAWAVIAAGTAAASINGDEYAVIAIDPVDIVEATARLNQAESLNNDITWIPVPIGADPIRIPLSNPLVNGTFSAGCVAAKSVGGVAVDLYIGAQ